MVVIRAVLASAICALAGAYHSFLRIHQTVDIHRHWRLVVTNPSSTDKVVTRMRGKLFMHSAGGKNNTEYTIPLGGFILDPKESCMTSLPLPLTAEPMLLTCSIEFLDVPWNEDRIYRDCITYFQRDTV